MRLSSLASGKSRPRVQTSVWRSSWSLQTHSRTRFIPSRGPCAQRTVRRQLAESASPRVSIAIRTNREHLVKRSSHLRFQSVNTIYPATAGDDLATTGYDMGCMAVHDVSFDVPLMTLGSRVDGAMARTF